MLIATYDYWGYYNVCFLGDEVEEPARNIPRAVLYSIIGVAILYVTMNISILGVLPWRELQYAAQTGTHFYVASLLMQKVYGAWAAKVVTILIMWTAFASVFSLLMGYSRVPYAAALDGNYFKAFAHVHPRHRFPDTSLLALSGAATLFCFLRLADIIAALVVIRILIQFLVQAVGLIVFRTTHPEAPRPFRMWFYPVPALLAIFGFTFILFKRPTFFKEIRYAAVILFSGLVVYSIRAWRRHEWPFAGSMMTTPD
jgi:amino acid transporter